MQDDIASSVTALKGARFACAFAKREFVPLIHVLAFPVVAAVLVLYVSLRAYLSELTQFVLSQDGRSASLALAALAAGIFVELFIAAIVVTSVSDLALSGRGRAGWAQFRADKAVWRVYAAYLRLLLVTAGFLAAMYLTSIFILARFVSPAAAVGVISATIMLGGCYWLCARLGFMIAPIIAQSSGSVLRKALQAGSQDGGRNLAVILLLSTPGILIEIAGEYLFRLGSGPAGFAITLPVVAYAHVLENRLAQFVFLSTLAVFASITLITAASIYCYRGRAFGESGATVPAGAVPSVVVSKFA